MAHSKIAYSFIGQVDKTQIRKGYLQMNATV